MYSYLSLRLRPGETLLTLPASGLGRHWDTFQLPSRLGSLASCSVLGIHAAGRVASVVGATTEDLTESYTALPRRCSERMCGV